MLSSKIWSGVGPSIMLWIIGSCEVKHFEIQILRLRKYITLIVINGNYNGVYWYVMDYIGGMLKPVGEMPQKHTTKGNFVMVLLEKDNCL